MHLHLCRVEEVVIYILHSCGIKSYDTIRRIRLRTESVWDQHDSYSFLNGNISYFLQVVFVSMADYIKHL